MGIVDECGFDSYDETYGSLRAVIILCYCPLLMPPCGEPLTPLF
jgi:hypothetical protein